LSDGWGEFLSEFHWDWYVTLTFAGDVKTFTARNRCNAWLRGIAKAAGQPISWFRGDEYGERLGKFHMHLLIGGVAHLHRFTWMKRWEKNGYARVFEFDSNQAAPFYVSKYVTKQFGEWEIGGDTEAFRIQQPNLPLTGQRGSGNNRVPEPETHGAPIQYPIREIIREKRSGGTACQLPLSDFRTPDLREIETDEIRKMFEEQTKRTR
jgi:hypothetical protein